MRRDMVKPFRRGGGAIWWGRVYAPAHLKAKRKELAALGFELKSDLAFSLRTTSLSEAKAKLAVKASEAVERWKHLEQALKDGPVALDTADQWAVATAITKRLIEAHKDHAGAIFEKAGMIAPETWKRILGVSDGLAGAIMGEVDKELAALGLIVTPKSRRGIGDKLVGYDSKAAALAISDAKLSRQDRPKVQWTSSGDLENIVAALNHMGKGMTSATSRQSRSIGNG
jgi:hypothetical protein